MKDKALTLYLNNSLNTLYWEEFVQLFNEEFSTNGELSLSNFSEITFKIGSDVSECYFLKKKCALWLDTKLLFEGLTDKLSRDLKQLVVINSPKTTTGWIKLVHWLNKLKIMESTKIRAIDFTLLHHYILILI